MNKHECELELFRLAKKMQEVYKQYDEMENSHVSICFMDGLIMGNNDYWEKERKGIDFRITDTSAYFLANKIKNIVCMYNRGKIEDVLEFVSKTEEDIKNGNVDYIKSYLKEITDEDGIPVKEAEEYIEELDFFTV